MPAFQHILVPTDFSESAAEAADYAVELAKSFDANLTLLHVHEFPVYAYATGIYLPTVDLFAAAKTATAEATGQLKARWQKTDGLIAEGFPWEQIIDVAKERGADLIVMGTHGRRGISRALLGSVAEKVVRMAPIPVLTIRPHEKPKAA
jgi:nucleotide-binding universal stress UspA family protein